MADLLRGAGRVVAAPLAALARWRNGKPMHPRGAVFDAVLERLFAGLMGGPNLNCRPHSSRQRLDLTQLAKLEA